MMGKEGHIQLSNYGRTQSIMSHCCSQSYVAPELTVSSAVDWWGVGVCIFKMLTGTLVRDFILWKLF